jgi:hypothetical protein
VTTTVLALDKMLRNLTDADRAEMRARAPVHLLDQLDAAAAQSERLFKGMGAAMKATVGGVDYANVPDWLRLSLVDTWARFIGGTIDTCQHAPRIDHPQPVVAAVWRPGLIVCAHCIHLTKATGTADLTCDRCARVCAGLDHGEGIHSCSITFGPLLYFFGLCPGCMTEHSEATS